MIGANAEAIATAEDRDKFKQAMIEIGLKVPASGIAHDMDEARERARRDRPAVHHPARLHPRWPRHGHRLHARRSSRSSPPTASTASPISEILIEKSIAGWKEYELEVMRDRADNCVIICSIENVDPMGVHTGDSITVAPAQTLSDVEYQQMRDAAFACIRRVGVETGGSNVQFAVNPATGEQVVIEMNPRVSRSSALASKATGFPIAKIAAKLAVGYTLDEISNDITSTPQRATPASFEPSIDYVVTKIPRWAFEKLPGTKGVLGTQMQSVGEAMSIGRTFTESLQKGLRSLEQGRYGLGCDPAEAHLAERTDDDLLAAVRRSHARAHLPGGRTAAPWRRHRRRSTTPAESTRGSSTRCSRSWKSGPCSPSCRPWPARCRRCRACGGVAKQFGFSDAQLGFLWGVDELDVRAAREAAGVHAHVQDGRHLRRRVRGARRRTTTARGRTRTRCGPATGRGWSSSAAARTASVRASSSTTAACTPRSRCARPASRR